VQPDESIPIEEWLLPHFPVVWKPVDDHKTEYPLAAEAVKKSCYVDDLMPSVETVETAKEMRQ